MLEACLAIIECTWLNQGALWLKDLCAAAAAGSGSSGRALALDGRLLFHSALIGLEVLSLQDLKLSW